MQNKLSANIWGSVVGFTSYVTKKSLLFKDRLRVCGKKNFLVIIINFFKLNILFRGEAVSSYSAMCPGPAYTDPSTGKIPNPNITEGFLGQSFFLGC